jgi:hypothetical protein
VKRGKKDCLREKNRPFPVLFSEALYLFSALWLPMRRGRKEEEELKRRIRSLLEEGKTYGEIRGETGAGRSLIAKVKKQLEREEVGHRSPLPVRVGEAAHHHTGAQDRGGEEGGGGRGGGS